MKRAGIFLRAEWRWLVMLNFTIDPRVLTPLLPRGTELDLWQGRALASVVGFRFLHTRVLGCALPGHTDFDEVNLRFYVRRQIAGEWRRGVVFVKEIVPRPFIAAVARRVYGENYIALPMRHTVDPGHGEYEYEWHMAGEWQTLGARTAGPGSEMEAGSEAEFILEHYWGYTRLPRGGTIEYEVEHPRWRIWTGLDARLDCDVAANYGPEFCPALTAKPHSAFVAEGSEVTIRRGVRI